MPASPFTCVGFPPSIDEGCTHIIRQAGSSPGSVHRSAAPSQGNAPVTSLQLRSPHSGETDRTCAII